MTNLYPHNQQAYEAVMQSFRTHQRAAVVHATGTGKSYIIAAVAEHFTKVLILAPNDFVLNETQKVCKQGTEFRTYAYVYYNATTMPTDYDLIVCDEFHRTGAAEWGAALQQLISANQQAKILGTSANDIRYTDGCRDMAEEMFAGNVVSRITLADAITRHLLPTPTYVCAVYSIDSDVRELQQRIIGSRKEDKDNDLRQLEQISQNWQNANGMSRIIGKYVPNTTQRILAFCSSIESVRNIEHLLRKWFNDAGFYNLKFYRITSDDRLSAKRMQQFTVNDYQGIKIAISVNMLNEGTHVPGVDGIIMLRTTMSRIIAEQQVGRCLTTNNSTRKPFVLDCVNNIYYFEDKYIERQQGHYLPKASRHNTTHEPIQYAFDIIDESHDIRDFLLYVSDKYSHHLWTREELEAEAKKYTTPREWQRNAINSYTVAVTRPYFAEITAHFVRKRMKWTREELEAEAKKYTHAYEWQKNNPGAYASAHKKPYYYEITAHFVNKGIKYSRHDLEVEAQKYSTPKEWQRANKQSFAAATVKPYYAEITAHMTRKRKEWTRRELEAEAKKYTYATEWQKQNPGAFASARKKLYYDEITAHFTDKRTKYSREYLEAEAHKYSTPSEWKNADNSTYTSARHRPYYAEITAHMSRKKEYSREELEAEARKYSTPNEWRNADPNMASAARRKPYYREITAHMTRNQRTKKQ